MTNRDVLNAKRVVEEFLRNNGVINIYSQTTSNSYGIYVNWSVKDITINGPSSTRWKNALTGSHIKGSIFVQEPNTFSSTDNGVWVGPFGSFPEAYTFADLLRRILYIQTHEDTKVAASTGINHIPMRLF